MNQKLFAVVFALASFCSVCSIADGQGFGQFGAAEPLSVSSWYELKEGTRDGKLFVKAEMGAGFHVYSQYHKGVEIASSMQVTESGDYQAGGKFVPDHKPHVSQKNDAHYEEFEHEVTWSTPIRLAETADPEKTKIKVKFRGMVCNEVGCRPPTTKNMAAAFKGFDADLDVSGFVEPNDSVIINELVGPAPTRGSADLPQRGGGSKTGSVIGSADSPESLAAMAKLYSPDTKIKYEKLDGSSGTGTFWAALFGAFVGGMLLNLMPCVFPVLGLKVLGFVEQAGNDPKKIKLHGIAFAAGLIFSMWCLAGAILALKAFWGQEVNWGQQMGTPISLAALSSCFLSWALILSVSLRWACS